MDGKLKSVVVAIAPASARSQECNCRAIAVGLIAGALPRYREYPRRRENCTTNCFGQSREQRQIDCR